MPSLRLLRATALLGLLTVAATPAAAQSPADSARRPASAEDPDPPTPRWADNVRYGGGPSIGSPPSDYDGAAPPTRWCLTAGEGEAVRGSWTIVEWERVTRGWLRRILSDTTDFGEVWRDVLGDTPRMAAGDSIEILTDEPLCAEVARLLNRELLGWKVGPPPIVLVRVGERYFAFPSNAQLGEFGHSVGLDSKRRIRGVGTW